MLAISVFVDMLYRLSFLYVRVCCHNCTVVALSQYNGIKIKLASSQACTVNLELTAN